MAKTVDQILNDLEALIPAEPSERNYVKLLLQQLRRLIGAELAAQIQWVGGTEWLVLHGDLSLDQGSARDRQNQLVSQVASACHKIDTSRSETQSWLLDDVLYIASPIQQNSWQAGGVLVRFSSNANVQISAMNPVLVAFGELIITHGLRWRSQRWLDQAAGLQTIMSNISECESQHQLHFTLANDLRVYLKADRVAVWRTQSKNQLKLVALSDCANEPSETGLPVSFRSLAEETYQSAKVTSRTENLSDQAVRNWMAFGWPRNRAGREQDFTIVAYWDDESRYADAIHNLRSSIVALEAVTTNVDRYLALPQWGRKLSQHTKVRSSNIRWAAIAVALVLVAWLGFRSSPLNIEGRASLEPVVQVNVFATHDGIVESLAVSDGSEVAEKQIVLQIRSVELDLEIEKLEGELLALAEKRNGFQISLNQLSADDPQGQLARSQLSSEIIELDQREKQLKQLVQLQKRKRDDLSIVSPCKGIVVTDNVKELLDHRPVKLGDALLQIADISGAWHLKVEVPDREAGHIRSAYAENKDVTVRFRLASEPDKEYLGRISRIAESVRPGANQESVWIIYVDFDPSQFPLRFGASVAVQFECGNRSTFYVWLRPLWENLRRRFWI